VRSWVENQREFARCDSDGPIEGQDYVQSLLADRFPLVG
jgi:hypothetical protein